MSISLEDQRFVTEINQHGMALMVEPAAEDIEATVLEAKSWFGEPSGQLLDENLLAAFGQYVGNVSYLP